MALHTGIEVTTAQFDDSRIFIVPVARSDPATGIAVAGYGIVDGRYATSDEMPGRLMVRGPTGCRYWRPDAQQRLTEAEDICVRHEDGFSGMAGRRSHVRGGSAR